MKKLTIIIAVAGILIFTGCKPEDIKSYEPYSAYNINNLQGTWKVSKVTQSDEDSKRKNFPYKTLDLTTSLNLSGIEISLNLNAAKPSTFSVNYGTAPQMFKFTEGNWQLDDVNKPGKFWLINNLDTVKFVLGAYTTLANNKLVLKQTKFLGNTPMITYEYEFSKN